LSILVLDVDGKLVTNNVIPPKEITDPLRSLLRRHNLIFASGRPYSGLKKIFSTLGKNCHAITLNGASIYIKLSTKPLVDFELNKEITFDILKRIWIEENITISAYSTSEWYIKKVNNNILNESKLLQIKPKQ